MPDVVLFAGPTLPMRVIIDKLGEPQDGFFALPQGRKLLVMPPVSEGDIAAIVAQAPTVIAIVDGYFENVPAVWHKEILYAMAEGIHVMGASSMGALRAAELSAFGMQGIGHIYNAYVTGKWEDDDEVTVAHGPAELGFLAVSEAMANIRATLDRALAATAITLTEWASLTSIAKNLYYKDRNYEKILQIAVQQGMQAQRAAELKLWVSCNRCDQKLTDALSLLDAIAEHLGGDAGRKKVLYHFEDTIIWRRARSLPYSLNANA